MARPRTQSEERAAFLNVPYDRKFENLFLAFIAGLRGFGLTPRATIEITGSRRRLERITALIGTCQFSFHDLSRVELDRTPPPTPRFNMPFELGLAVSMANSRAGGHKWFVFESNAHRLKKSLSDLDGTDPYVHDGTPYGVLRALANALSREHNGPTLSELEAIYLEVRKVAVIKSRELRGGSLFEAQPFRDLVVFAGISAQERIASLRKERGSLR
ncbi:MAG TPA: hypothetical protein VMT61_06720 [Candidatus Binataceae bacterium]|nr:hypothetical protein [Candidatus Binataceae bacterium]